MKKLIYVAFCAGVSGILSLLPADNLDAQGVIRGSVVDSASGRALTSAIVRIDSLNIFVLSDQSGKYILSNVPAGTHWLTIRYLSYGTVQRSVQVADGRTVDFLIRLSPKKSELGTVIIEGARQGQAAALNQQRQSANVTNVVAADQIGRFPDSNIGDALKRIPGIGVTVDQGEARFGLIRGTEPRLNSITINGERIASAEAEVREVQLDLVPADMVKAIEVNKTLIPEMDADAIGGSVNIVTLSAPHEPRISLTLGSGYNPLAGKAMGIGSGVIGRRFLGGKLGAVISGSYFNHFLGSDDIEAEWDLGSDDKPYVADFQIREYQIQRLRRSISATIDYQLGSNSTLILSSIYNHRNDWENRFRKIFIMDEPDANGVVSGAEIRRETKGGGPGLKNARLEAQRTQSHSLTGQHLLGSRVITNWGLAIGSASETRPDERYIGWVVEGVDVNTDISNSRSPKFSEVSAVSMNDFEFRRIELMDEFTKDKDFNGRLDFQVATNFANRQGTFKFGGRFRTKEKLRDNTFFRAAPLAGSLENLSQTTTSDFSNSDFLAGKYMVGNFTTPKFLSDLELRDGTLFELQDRPDEYAAANYNAKERIYAGYAQLNQQVTDKISVLFGLRVERTNIRYTGNEFDVDEEAVTSRSGKNGYTSFLPSINARWDFENSSVLRFAWSNSIARPNYYDLVPYRVVSLEDSEMAVGNPGLKPTTSMNFDLFGERYFSNIGLVSTGIFYKDIRDFIFEYTKNNSVDPVTGATFDEISKPENGSKASLFGFEASIQRQLDFLPGIGRYFGIYANYTFTTSSVNGLNVEGRENEDLPLPGSAKHSGNGSISFDASRLSLRLSTNFQSSFIDPGEVGDSPFYDRYYARSVHVDANGSYSVTSKVRVFFEANNLSNQPLRYYQGVKNRIMQDEYYNARFSFGLKYDL